MKTFSQFHNEIEGYQDVKKTVEAEEKISVAGVHQLLKENTQIEDYTQSLERVISRFILCDGEEKELSLPPKKGKILVVFGGNKGFVSGLWNRLTERLVAEINNYRKVVIYGKAISEKLKSAEIKSGFNLSYFPFPQRKDFLSLQSELLEMFRKKTFSQVDVLWPKIITLNYFQPTRKTILPFKMEARAETKKGEEKPSWPIFEPNKKEVFKALSERYLSLLTYQTIIETKLAESLSRATSMEKAKAEVDKIIKKITHNFFTERRKVLTENQIEIFMAHKATKKYD